jgi:hypothetical protein
MFKEETQNNETDIYFRYEFIIITNRRGNILTGAKKSENNTKQ